MTIKIQRAWDGRLKRIDNLMSWLYDNVMTDSEKQKKDTIFRRYYRFYNDGDSPRGYQRSCGLSREAWIETTVEAFIKQMLVKYRTATKTQYYKKAILSLVVNTKAIDTGDNRICGLLDSYYAEQYANKYNIKQLKSLMKQVKDTQNKLANLEKQAGTMILNHYKSSKLYDQQLVDNNFDLKFYLSHRKG